MREGRLTAILVAALVVVLVGGGATAYLVGRDRTVVAAPATPPIDTPPASDAETDIPGPVPSEPPASEPSRKTTSEPSRETTSAGPTPAEPPTAEPTTAEPPTAEPPTAEPTTKDAGSTGAEPPATSRKPDPSAAPTDDTEVAIAGVAADDPQAEEIRSLLQRHFDAINNRDYAGWTTTVTAELSNVLPEEQWLKEYSTTRDTDINVIRIYTDPREVDITFRSRQDKALSPEGKYTCLNWQVTHPLTEGPDGLRIERSVESDADWRPCSTG